MIKTYSKLCLETLIEHFKKLSQDDNNYYKSPLFEHPEDHGEITTEINTDFTEAGILVSISRLKNNKACGSDYIQNELIKKPHQYLLNSSAVSSIWSSILALSPVKV